MLRLLSAEACDRFVGKAVFEAEISVPQQLQQRERVPDADHV